MDKKPVGNSSTIRLEHFHDIQPESENQKKAFDAWKNGKHIFLTGSAGTGKTFLGLFLALTTALQKDSEFDNVTIIRSVVPTRNMGLLPGTEEEKTETFLKPYQKICSDLTGSGGAYAILNKNKKLIFETTSFIRGLTFENTILVVDECQNLNGHELDSVITRMGNNCRIIFCGDYYQSDFMREREKSGINQFLAIIEQMKDFEVVKFTWADILRSNIVRDYIMTKEMLGVKF